MKELFPWFERHQRALPWRDTARDPYRVWVSEIMLQQTRVETVLRYYARFLETFPDVRALAEAPEDALMKAWEGLGYYRRARLLQKGAKHVVENGMPVTRDAWLAVPGVGPYTAGAIASLCSGERVAAVDGNVLRVFSRQTRYEDDITSPSALRAAQAWVLAHQPPRQSGPFNESLMELGATVCAPTRPRCAECPVASGCQGRGREDLPRKPRRAAKPEIEVALAICWRGSKLLIEKRESGLLAGTWGLPWVEGGRAELAAHLEARLGAGVQVAPDVVASGVHVFTHRRWKMRAYMVTTRGKRGDWRDPASVALGSAHRKILRLLVEA